MICPKKQLDDTKTRSSSELDHSACNRNPNHLLHIFEPAPFPSQTEGAENAKSEVSTSCATLSRQHLVLLKMDASWFDRDLWQRVLGFGIFLFVVNLVSNPRMSWPTSD